ncbi:MAG: hypothetical protein UX23_C0001G0044 [Parcubacteria group bacterium GW2011_GWB1_45_9]|nr:MAG: hypothetical protein UX23_C0001G0044 [Parcubacteria group bacterium GW2011_GWB1_45_9]
MKTNRRLVLAEVVLLLASVFIFRSVWLLLDTLSVMHDAQMLWFSLTIGVAITIPSLRYIIRHSK